MASDKRTSSLEEPMDVAEYLFRRLAEVGIKSVHGVPGDYNLVALDYVPKAGLSWVGNVNELNGAYAADGYARVNGMAAMVTTFGVGELSAINGQAGSFAEYVPVVHIVGTPSTLSQKDGMLLHHTLGNGDFNVFSKMFESVSCHVAKLIDPAQAANQIDDAIRECYIQSRPVYIALPTDMVEKKVDGARLKTKLDLKYPENKKEQEDYAVEQVLKHLHAAKNPVILVDACTIRHRAQEEVHEFINKSGLPTFVTPMGKGAVDETTPNYGGVYAGSGSNETVRKMVESADLVLSFGAIKSDFNTAGFTYRISELSTIDFHSNLVKVGFSEYHGLRMNGVIRKVTQQMGKLNVQDIPTATAIHPEMADKPDDSEVITHAWFWPKLTGWVRENDIIVTETGTSGYGIWEVKFAKGVTGISQILWGSIGYAFGSLQGAVLAASETTSDRRTILFTGDGSFQLTAQELSTIIRHDLHPIIFVICNEGYTIERYIHGMNATYNDVGQWSYASLPASFGARDGSYKTYSIKTRSDVRKLLEDEEFAAGGGGKGEGKKQVLRFVELYMPKEDAPAPLKITAEASARNNAKQ